MVVVMRGARFVDGGVVCDGPVVVRARRDEPPDEGDRRTRGRDGDVEIHGGGRHRRGRRPVQDHGGEGQEDAADDADRAGRRAEAELAWVEVVPAVRDAQHDRDAVRNLERADRQA